MATKITSRPSTKDDAESLDLLREILSVATRGEFDRVIVNYPADTLPEITKHVDAAVTGLLLEMDALTKLVIAYEDMANQLSIRNAEISIMLAKLTGTVEFDDALDHATTDLIDDFVSSGSAETTFDGEISFTENVVFSPTDLKPYLRNAISTWLDVKLR